MEEKIALVTGASRGIGSQIAKTLAKKNIFVVVNYSGSKEKAEQTAEEIINAGGKAVVYGCDISDFYATEDMVKEIVKQYGRLDILINNAGITKDNLIMRMSEADFDRVIEVNLKGAFNTIHAAARQMIRQKSGKIVNIASVSRCAWKCRSGKLCSCKSRDHRPYQNHSPRICRQKYSGKCRCTRIY